MKAYLPYLVIGVTTGSIYGLAAVGLVLTYKSSGVFNLAHGAIAALAAFSFFALHQRSHWPWPVALMFAVVVLGVIGGMMFERLAAGLAKVPSAYRIVATVGLLVAILAAIQLAFGVNTLEFSTFLPQRAPLIIDGVRVTIDNLASLGVGAVGAGGLYLYFRVSRSGTEMRALVDAPDLLDLSGISPTRVRRRAWVIGVTFTALSGVLFAETLQSIDPDVLSLLAVYALGAVALASFSSIPLAYVGGLFVGVVQALVGKEVAAHSSLSGLDFNTSFIVLLVMLMVLPRQRLVEVGRHVKARTVRPLPLPAAMTRYCGALTVAVLVPLFVGTRLPLWNNALTQVVLFASLGLLVRTSGQLSLCQWGFAAIGGSVFAHMLAYGLPWGGAVLVAALIVVPVGMLIALPAARLSGLYLGLLTLGFGILLSQFFYLKPFMFGVGGDLATRQPDVAGLDSAKGFYYLLLAIAVVSLVAVSLIERSRLGRLARGLADSPVALSSLGANVNVTRVIVFGVSAFLAGVSGATYASLFGSINLDSFGYLTSLELVVVLVVAGRRTLTAALVAPLLFVVLPGYITSPSFSLGLQIALGVVAVLASLGSNRSLKDVLVAVSRVHISPSHGAIVAEGRRVSTNGERLALLAARSTGARPLGSVLIDEDDVLMRTGRRGR